MRMIIFFIVCLLTIDLLTHAGASRRYGLRNRINRIRSQLDFLHRREDSCKEKGEECSSSSECCNIGCAVKNEATGERYECQICSTDMKDYKRKCFYP